MSTRPKISLAGAHAAVVGDLLLLRPSMPRLSPCQRRAKRLVDVLGSLLVLVLTAPVLVLSAVLVGLTSSGPVILAETCMGACGKKFSRYRFRTTVIDGGEQTGSKHTARLTRVGRLLRATSIDELPQLFNVLSGEMSLIGPRPEEPRHMKLLRDRFPAYELRFAAKPGILGLAESDGCHSSSPELKLHYDLKYVYQSSLALDLRIVLRSVLRLLPAQPSKPPKKEPERAQESTAMKGRLRARFID